MSEVADKMRQALHLFADIHGIKTILTGVAKNVNDNTCSVFLDEDTELFDVRLNAVVDNIINRITIVPKEDSQVLIGLIENKKEEAVIIACSEIESVHIQIGTAVFNVRDSKIKMEADGINLKNVLSGVIAKIQAIVVTQGVGPDVPGLTLLNNQLLQILE